MKKRAVFLLALMLASCASGSSTTPSANVVTTQSIVRDLTVRSTANGRAISFSVESAQYGLVPMSIVMTTTATAGGRMIRYETDAPSIHFSMVSEYQQNDRLGSTSIRYTTPDGVSHTQTASSLVGTSQDDAMTSSAISTFLNNRRAQSANVSGSGRSTSAILVPQCGSACAPLLLLAQPELFALCYATCVLGTSLD